ncbi:MULTISPECIES: CoA ester lyase [Pseudomonas]|uniref:HpcH/HpaI aldolase/citrate lyase family protein n=1 Tax=Pseudomonas TaxID=286 RepID=UPI0021152682|nr:CoA ester lyase [Pseudomonas sp. MYb187]
MKKSEMTSVKSALFVPGSRPERFSKAIATGADRIIVDFEDAVEEGLKRQARHNLQAWLEIHPTARLLVRINAFDHPEFCADLNFCNAHPGVDAVILPKAESRDQVEQVTAHGKRVWPLIESARGIEALTEIAQATNVERLTFGALDMGLDLGLRSGTAAATRIFDQVRYQLLLHSTLASLARPVETVYPIIDDPQGLEVFAGSALQMGFGGMLCIHPNQVSVANRIFSPTDDEIAWARKVSAAAQENGGAFRLDGRMIDAPVLAQARRLLNAVP